MKNKFANMAVLYTFVIYKRITVYRTPVEIPASQSRDFFF